MEIEVGEYVRTKNGHIRHIKKILEYKDNWYTVCDVEGYINYKLYNMYIAKHSKNIIDLIEVGDYVNGKEVKHIAMFEGFPDYPKIIFVDERKLLPHETCENCEIKSIVTKEQFQNMEYRLGEE